MEVDPAVKQIAQIIQNDVGGRGIKNIFPDDNYENFQKAAYTLIKANKVAIMTGFSCIIDSEPHIENDGLAGSLALAKCLLNLNKEVAFLMDSHSESYMKEIITNYLKEASPSLNTKLNLYCFETEHQTLSD